MFRKNKKKEEGFVILIAVMISMILLSIGIFISTIAVREIRLSSSAKESQKAFFAADTVQECALRKAWGASGGFKTSNYSSSDIDNFLECNKKKFKYESSYVDGGVQIHKFYISLYDGTITTADGTENITKDDIDADANTKRYPYVFLRVEMYFDPATGDLDKTVLKSYGHNVRDGNSIIERAIEIET